MLHGLQSFEGLLNVESLQFTPIITNYMVYMVDLHYIICLNVRTIPSRNNTAKEKMILKFSLIFLCFFVNLIDLSNLTASNDESRDNLDIDEDIDPQSLSFKDKFNLHHAFVIEKEKWKDGLIFFKIDKNFSGKFVDISIEKIF